jgi:alpha-galactosidase
MNRVLKRIAALAFVFLAVAHGWAAPEILTPPAAHTPRVNGPKVFGARPGSPFFYAIPATGDRPMTFSAEGLPKGLTLDAAKGWITGSLATTGTWQAMLTARNALGSAQKPFRIVAGEEIALTPQMGWNSWNCFGTSITQEKAVRAARALVALGLDQHGWTYVNIDDGWQGSRSGPDNALQAVPQTFGDIKGMVDQIHALGLKAGLYDTPWTLSYGGHPGSTSDNPTGVLDPGINRKAPRNSGVLPYAIGKYSFVKVDARQFAQWGFDYLKYDWGPVEAPATREMYEALRATGRDIVLSVSNNHVRNLLSIIGQVSPWAESWRTTTDITDNWGRVANDIGFAQGPWAPYSRPGHFNDADMLVVGEVFGWGKKPHPTRLTPDEQYTHISLWCLLSSPLLIGCDLEQVDPFTLGLLTNDEVLDIDQDSLGKAATQVAGTGDEKVYAKPLDDGSWAVGLFNTGKTPADIAVKWSDLKLSGRQRVRDLWRQADVGTFDDQYHATVAPHGVMLVRLFPSP